MQSGIGGANSVKSFNSGSKLVDNLQEVFSVINEALNQCHSKMDSLLGVTPATAISKGADGGAAYSQVLETAVRMKDSIQALADRMSEL